MLTKQLEVSYIPSLIKINLNYFSSTSKSTSFLDYQSTTPLDPRVLDAMLPYMTVRYGNAHSRSHDFGWEAAKIVNLSRNNISSLIGASPSEIIFTSGATESNNLAIKGLASYHPKKKHIITTKIEHKCIMNTCRYLENNGYKISYLPVDKYGLVNPLDVLHSIKSDTLMLSTIMVHNEIGTIQPILELGKICRKKGIYFHTDAAQALGKIPINVNKLNIDLMSMSGHKIYGPKGIGALYIRKKPRVRINPMLNGGGQERGFRSGTLPVHLIVGFGKAAEISKNTMEFDYQHIKKLFDKLYNKLKENLSDIYINGPINLANRYPGNLNISFEFVEGESLIIGVKDIAVSSGSACTSASLEPSYVLNAIGVKEDLAHSSLRIGIGRFTTEEEINKAINIIIKNVNRLRLLSPLWEMKKEGIELSKIDWAKH